jgi:hypothetical protein
VTDPAISSTPMLGPSVQQPLDIAPALDRLEWRHWRPAAQALIRDPKPTPGRRSQPVADAPSGSLQWGWDRDGHPVWIRTWFAGVPAGYDAVRTEAAHALAPLDAIVPPIVEAATAETVCLNRMRWAAPDVNPAHDIVRRFVESSLLDALASGRCVIAGEAHVLDDKRLVVEDIGGIFRLESVDRTMLFETVDALVAGSTTRLEALIATATGGLDDHRRWVAKRCAAGLIVEWSSLGFTLALRDVARTLLISGSTHASSLCAIADELAHRTDLAHRYRCPSAFASATAVHHLLEQAA